MASIMFWRDVSPSGTPGFDEVNSFFYDTVTGFTSSTSNNVPTGVNGDFHPPVGTVLLQHCEGLDFVKYKSQGNALTVVVETIPDSPSCCTLQASDFNIVRTNNTNQLTPNGTIVITAPFLTISDYEASIDGGANWITQVGSEITFDSLPAGDYSIIIRVIGGGCSVTSSINIAEQFTYPPLIIEEETQPPLYSPIFHPITLGYKLLNNTASVKQDLNGTYLEVGTQDGKDYLATLPIIKLLGNVDYNGNKQITSVDDVNNPQKFYLDMVYTTDQDVLFVPFDRQVFQLFCETAFNNYVKIADITVYPDATGEYLLRLEGFLQSAFRVLPPVNDGDEITLLRKYYVMPVDFDMEESATVYNAVYSAIEDLTPFLADLIPLGPAPINFISQLTARGLPVLFSYIDITTGRIVNVTSSNQTNVVESGPLVLMVGLPLNIYDFQWINPAGAIADLQVSPALPAWITLLSSASDTVKLLIDTGVSIEGGDYDATDYSEDDYLTAGVNLIVGCHEFEFSDGVTPLFTLRICIFPIQASAEVCDSAANFNIAWINREGGWSSYVFEGQKSYGVDMGKVNTYKKSRQLRRSSVEEVYNTAEVSLSNKTMQEMDFITSLRYSIQAFLWSNLTQQWSIPIILDKENFNKYSRPFRQIEVDEKFTFRYAEEVVIQTQ